MATKCGHQLELRGTLSNKYSANFGVKARTQGCVAAISSNSTSVVDFARLSCLSATKGRSAPWTPAARSRRKLNDARASSTLLAWVTRCTLWQAAARNDFARANAASTINLATDAVHISYSTKNKSIGGVPNTMKFVMTPTPWSSDAWNATDRWVGHTS